MDIIGSAIAAYYINNTQHTKNTVDLNTGNSPQFVKESLTAMIANPLNYQLDFTYANLVQPILGTWEKQEKQAKESYVCKIYINSNEITLTHEADSSAILISTNTNPPQTVKLPDVQIATLKRASLLNYLTTERQLGNKAINLSQFDLSEVDLKDIPLSEAVLNQKNLIIAITSEGDISGAMLEKGTNVKDLPCAGVRMDRSMLFVLIEGKADLRGIDVSGTDLSGMSLINLDFSDANFTNTNLNEANLKGANFNNTDLTGANLTKALIDRTDFISAKITNQQQKKAIGVPLQDIASSSINLSELFDDKKLKEKLRHFSFNTFNTYNPVKSNITDKLSPHLKIAKRYEYPPQSRNERVTFKNSSFFQKEWIVCRHSVTQFVVDTLAAPDGKIDYRKYSSPQELRNHISPAIEQMVSHLELQAKEIHLIDNNQFGQFLANQFSEMERTKVTVRAMKLSNDRPDVRHAMGISLRIYTNHANDKIYAVEFIEPNIGEASPVHSKATNSPQQFAHQKLADYICGAGDAKLVYQIYYDKENEFSRVYIHEKLESVISLQPKAEKPKLIYYQTDLTARHIHFMLWENNFDLESIQKLPQEEQHKLLAEHCNFYYSSIKKALSYKDLEGIRAYKKLILSVTDQKLLRALLRTLIEEAHTRGIKVSLL